MIYKPDIVIKWFAKHGLKAEPEYKFHPKRRWRFDFAFIGEKVALEVEGGIWTGGRHTRASGFLKDMEKYNEAACLGWRIIRTTPYELCMAETLETIRRAMTADKHLE